MSVDAVQRSAVWLLAACLGAILCAALGWQRRPADSPLPTLRSASNRLDPEGCRDCHWDVVDRFSAAPHQRTLHRGDDPALVARLAERSLETPLGHFQFSRDGDWLSLHSDRHAAAASVDWIFGSGQHALTPVSVWESMSGQLESSQLHVSWYRGDVLGLTPGSESVAADPPTLGIPHNGQQTAECFGCHATYLPELDGRIDLERMLPGVSCSRCHPGAREHADSGGDVETLTGWAELTPLESVRRCGECHRRDDQMTEHEIGVGRADELARFASVGLVQSRCFTATMDGDFGGTGTLRMDCLTCHDPHRPASDDAAHYNRRCAECHGQQAHQAGPCPTAAAGADCLACHMPKASTVEHLWFTDHWIRRPPASTEE